MVDFRDYPEGMDTNRYESDRGWFTPLIMGGVAFALLVPALIGTGFVINKIMMRSTKPVVAEEVLPLPPEPPIPVPLAPLPSPAPIPVPLGPLTPPPPSPAAQLRADVQKMLDKLPTTMNYVENEKGEIVWQCEGRGFPWNDTHGGYIVPCWDIGTDSIAPVHEMRPVTTFMLPAFSVHGELVPDPTSKPSAGVKINPAHGDVK